MEDHLNRPSKQFLKRGAIAIGILAIILVVQTTWFRHIFTKKSSSPIVASTTVGDLVTKDTNGNGIADWEERLWGLDPTVLYTNGVSNESIIAGKKKSLGVANTTSDANLDDTDRLARELFTLTAALGQSDEVDSATLRTIAAKLGSSVDIRAVSNQYSLKDLQTVQTTIASLTKYRTSMQAVIKKYDVNTPDIEVLATALQNEDYSGLPQLTQSAVIYQRLAKELTAVPTPIGLATNHLSIINGFSGIATSFTYMRELDDNSLKALVGVAVYKNYANKLAIATSQMNDYLIQYGILQ